MKEKIKYITNKKTFHLAMLIIIISIILFVVGILVLQYTVEGETNMPFELTKISVISSTGGNTKEATNTKWAFDVYQSNDIYLYIDKNEKYDKTEIITSILINNIKLEGENSSKMKLYKPDSQAENQIFINKQENIVENIEFKGAMESNLKNLEISNQGGIIGFRCLYDNIGEYLSDDEVINHQQLLQKLGITNEQLKGKLTFDFIIKTQSGKEYSSNISIDIPVGDVVGQGLTSNEITNLDQFIFKRIKN